MPSIVHSQNNITMEGFTNHDPVGGYALLYFILDQAIEVVTGFEDARLIMGLGEITEVTLVPNSQFFARRKNEPAQFKERTVSRGLTMSYLSMFEGSAKFH